MSVYLTEAEYRLFAKRPKQTWLNCAANGIAQEPVPTSQQALLVNSTHGPSRHGSDKPSGDSQNSGSTSQTPVQYYKSQDSSALLTVEEGEMDNVPSAEDIKGSPSQYHHQSSNKEIRNSPSQDTDSGEEIHFSGSSNSLSNTTDEIVDSSTCIPAVVEQDILDSEEVVIDNVTEKLNCEAQGDEGKGTSSESLNTSSAERSLVNDNHTSRHDHLTDSEKEEDCVESRTKDLTSGEIEIDATTILTGSDDISSDSNGSVPHHTDTAVTLDGVHVSDDGSVPSIGCEDKVEESTHLNPSDCNTSVSEAIDTDDKLNSQNAEGTDGDLSSCNHLQETQDTGNQVATSSNDGCLNTNLPSSNGVDEVVNLDVLDGAGIDSGLLAIDPLMETATTCSVESGGRDCLPDDVGDTADCSDAGQSIVPITDNEDANTEIQIDNVESANAPQDESGDSRRLSIGQSELPEVEALCNATTHITPSIPTDDSNSLSGGSQSQLAKVRTFSDDNEEGDRPQTTVDVCSVKKMEGDELAEEEVIIIRSDEDGNPSVNDDIQRTISDHTEMDPGKATQSDDNEHMENVKTDDDDVMANASHQEEREDTISTLSEPVMAEHAAENVAGNADIERNEAAVSSRPKEMEGGRSSGDTEAEHASNTTEQQDINTDNEVLYYCIIPFKRPGHFMEVILGERLLRC